MGPFPEGRLDRHRRHQRRRRVDPGAVHHRHHSAGDPGAVLVGNILTISAEPSTELTVTVDVGRVNATATVTADNSGLSVLNLLTDLDIDFSWDQLLNAQVSVVSRDPANGQATQRASASAPASSNR